MTELIGNTASLRALSPDAFVDDTFGLPTVTDILAELEKPGRDPRPAFVTATFAEGVEKIADLRIGMVLQGVVTNVAAFGAFVDVGVHQDGLVHVSAMSRTFVSDPRQVVTSGQVVTVKVMEVDEARKRISLTLRLDDEPGAPATRPARTRRGSTATANPAWSIGGLEGPRVARSPATRNRRVDGRRAQAGRPGRLMAPRDLSLSPSPDCTGPTRVIVKDRVADSGRMFDDHARAGFSRPRIRDDHAAPHTTRRAFLETRRRSRAEPHDRRRQARAGYRLVTAG